MGARRARTCARQRPRSCGEVGVAGARRCGLPDRQKVVVSAQGQAAALSRLQLRRGRAGHVQRSHAARRDAAPGDRRNADRRLRDRLASRLHLHPRRVQARLRDLLCGARRGETCRLRRQEHLRQRLRPRANRPSRCRRVHLRRRDGAAQLARRQARRAASEAAVPRHRRSLRHADRGQQRRDAGVSRSDSRARCAMVCRRRDRAQQRI